jgi:predicted RNA-binding protein with PUA-like domain
MSMAGKWLFKTEPSEYSFERLVKEGKARWDGVTNPVALKNLRGVKKGDAVLVYHTGDVRAAVGLARAASDAYPDPKAGDPRIVCVDIEPDRALGKPVTLAAIKADARFKEFVLVRQGRLSVMAVPEELWEAMLAMSR